MKTEAGLRRHLSPMAAWAFSIGTSVGWGSLVVTSSTYLAQAGPLGSVLGLLIGMLIMLVISRSYAYLMQCFPDAGGAYIYTREIFGPDQGFLTAWFLAMTYFAVLWANATSLPLFSRIFLGGVFHFGRLYTIFGYDVFLGEALLSAASIALVAFVCIRFSRAVDVLMIVLAGLFTVGIAVCFFAAAFGGHVSFAPAFVPDSHALGQVVKIAVISPWAFIGFESISHAAEEFDFERRRLRTVLRIAVISTLALYVFVTLLSVAAYPERYGSWLAYIRDLDNLEGLEALPAFYAANRCMGGVGVLILTLSLLALVITSIIGNMSALSRLVYAMAKDRILPERFAALNARGVPAKAVLLVAGISCFVPLVGRTAIGWIVDVTTIGATIIYAFVAAAAAEMGKDMEDRAEMWAGRVGLGIMIAFGAYILVPNLVGHGSMAKETYFLFIIWSVLGFLFFRDILRRDREKRFGGSVIVWVALLALVLFVALIWMRQSMIAANDQMRENIAEYYETVGERVHQRVEDEEYIAGQMRELEKSDTRTMLMAVGMFGFALIIMMTNHSYLNKRSRESEMLANTDPMTGVKNKLAFINKEKELDAAINDGHAPDFSIVVCDVNGLKKINDTLGHKAGDEYIRSACAMICDIFQHSPVYRVGGDEFVVIMTGRDYVIRRELMAALHDRSVDHITAGGAVVSGGISDYNAEEDNHAHAVFERADTGMYEEKRRLKSLGAVTRDDESDAAAAEEDLPVAVPAEPVIINIRRHILIVEDEPVSQILLGNALEESYDLLYAADGVEAMEQVKAHKDQLALVMLDLQMPRMNGFEVLRAMKADQELCRIPVIVLTSDQGAEVECLQLGAMDFVSKPYPMWEIIKARVNKCIEFSENQEIIQSTERDSLTRLFNIDYFLRYVQMFDQHYWDMAMDAVVVDIHHFHMVNERYGKVYGDAVLRRIGERIRTLARELGGVGCRRDGASFLIYCPHRQDYSSVLERISSGLMGDEGASRIRLRMGVYAEVDKELDIERRFDRAKLAADTVKGNFATPVGYYDEQMHEAALFRERLLEDFAGSLEQGRFTVYYQPKFDIRPDTPVLSSAEALVRWNHPTLGIISPGVFIPLLEENGLILELDKYVWRQAARQIRAWKDKLGFSVPISVNVSRIDMLMPNLKEIFHGIVEENGLQASDIVLEITESAYTGDSEQVISAARELRGMGMGFRIEMDDFGTGYSSLGLLAHLPIDALKLDMTFIRSAFGETRDVRMIELIIDIADYLHVPVVAEGVETEEQYRVLKAMGCDLIQGYYFSKPVPAAEFEPFLITRRGQAVGPVQTPKKSYMSLSRALTGNFESIFYVDMLTDFYLEFYSGPGGELQIRPGGADFFRDAKEKLLPDVVPEDAERLEKLFRREALLKLLGSGESVTVPFTRQKGGERRAWRLQTIRTRGADDSHVVIGIRPE